MGLYGEYLDPGAVQLECNSCASNTYAFDPNVWGTWNPTFPTTYPSTGFEIFVDPEEEETLPSLEESIKDILTELLHTEGFSPELMEKFSAFKAAFELEEESMKLTRKRLKLAEHMLRKRL